jgi:hypothetical protein
LWPTERQDQRFLPAVFVFGIAPKICGDAGQ